MTILVPYSRALSKQLPIRSGLLTRLISTNSNLRVTYRQTGNKSSESAQNSSKWVIVDVQAKKGYATAAKVAARPKAHTGRTTTKRTTTTKKAAPKKKAAAKAKPKKKPVKKAKAKPKPKPRIKKPLSATAIKAKESAARTASKQKALLHQEPKGAPDSAWLVFSTTRSKNATGSGKVDVTSVVKESASAYKSLAPAEREALNHTANENKAKNEAAYKRWVQSFTPLQIREANNARNALLREAKVKKVKNLGPYRSIKDDRLPRHPLTALALFVRERFATGDFKGMTGREALPLISREYTALNPSAKKPFEDRAAADRNRYVAEHKTVYGVEPVSRAAKATA